MNTVLQYCTVGEATLQYMKGVEVAWERVEEGLGVQSRGYSMLTLLTFKLISLGSHY